MTEYTTDSHLNANCILIAEEIEAHANSRAYEDEDGNVVILDGDDEPTDEMEYRGLYDFINDALDIEVTYSLSGDYRGAKLYMTVGFDYQLDRHCSKTPRPRKPCRLRGLRVPRRY